MSANKAFTEAATKAINAFAVRCETLQRQLPVEPSNEKSVIVEMLGLISSQLNQIASIQLELLKDATEPRGLGTMPPEGPASEVN